MVTSFSMETILLAASALFLLGVGFFTLAATSEQNDRRTLARIRQGAGSEEDSSRLDWLSRLGRRGEAATGRDPELVRLLIQAGFRNSRSLELFQGIRLLLVLLLVILYLPFSSYFGQSDFWLYGGAFVMFALGYLIPKWLLVRLASRRRQKLENETQMFAALSRILLHSGLSVQQLLTVVEEESHRLLPESAKELERVLRQVAMGAEMEDLLPRLGRELEIPDLEELLKLLAQVQRFGGAVDAPFGRFLLTLEQNRRIRLEEKVNLLSGKMTVVMVLFEFPALLAFLGAPGFIAIINALGGVGVD